MASGDVVGIITEISSPTTAFATVDTLTGGSTPAEVVTVWDFDSAATESLDFRGSLDGYAATTGLTITVVWSASSAVAADATSMVWQGAFRRIADDAEDIGSSHSYQFNPASAATPPSAVGETSEETITFTDGTDMDDLADGDPFIFRLQRDHDAAGDDMSGDAELWFIVIRET